MATVACGFTLTATTVVQPTVSGTLDVTCSLYVTGTKVCHIAGATPATYTNETGTLQTPTSRNGLTVSGANCPFGSNDLVHLTARTFVVLGAKPTITRA